MPGLRPTLVPVGVGTAYARPGEAQSCYLVRTGATAVAVDLGSGTLNRLQDQIAPEDLAALVITHLHPDHCADLMALRVYMVWGPGAGHTLRVLSPPGLKERLVAFSGSQGWDSAFTFEDLTGAEGERELAAGLGLRFREVPHLAPTYAVRLEGGGGSLCYSADCAPGPALPALAEGCDVLLCESSFGEEEVPEGADHLNGREAGRAAAAAGAGRLLLTHCFPEHDRDATLAAARAEFDGPVAWARQGEPVET
jgi:ribonuclease BN (tRNA processing enzyme)